ncbi:unnamed protein product [Vitrella brassicaformis CCMP3155]|uniref:Uncharacterized protein n=1 Tax=Vitrella brassicaformis (strain CCMP3155) TaxID=1169540 RepID=A0A0G4ESQ1_VITBC|nr:unnamed protein product [Vitrella brassicaformis CCMP3155]|eukprot:CEM00898.1 unnamed protein product [Vitrella brassicaformis CCMP3155]
MSSAAAASPALIICHFRSIGGREGAFPVCPLVLELQLLCHGRDDVQFKPMPFMEAGGHALPFGISRQAVISASSLYEHVQEMMSASPSAKKDGGLAIEESGDVAFSVMVDEIDRVIHHLIWADADLFSSFTAPLLLKSIPWPLSWWSVAHARLAASVQGGGAVVADELHDILIALERRLRAPVGRQLEARVFSRLAILFSLPFPSSSPVPAVLRSKHGLVQFCDSVLKRQPALWPNRATFLRGAMPPREGRKAKEGQEGGGRTCRPLSKDTLSQGMC